MRNEYIIDCDDEEKNENDEVLDGIKFFFTMLFVILVFAFAL